MSSRNLIPYVRRAKRIIQSEVQNSSYDVLEITPNRANVQQTYQLAGNPESLVSSASSFLAATQYLGERFGDWDFEKWDQDFVNCFPRAAARPTAWGSVATPWGKPINQRPKFVELNNPTEDGYKLVAFYPDRTNDEECYPLMGSINDIMNQAMHIMHFKMLSSELGHIVGEPVTEYIRHSPMQEVYLVFYLSTRKKPPYYKKLLNQEYREHYFTIHYPDISKLSYANLRTTIGGDNGLTWGYWKATAWIADNPDNFKKGKAAHQIWVAGDTEDTAKRNLEKVLALTTGKVLRINTSCTDRTKGTLRNDPHAERWKSYKVYPKQFLVFNPKLVALAEKGQRKTLAGKLNTSKNKFTLYNREEPLGWNDLLLKFIRTTTPETNTNQ